jgi:hypothetical protein
LSGDADGDDELFRSAKTVSGIKAIVASQTPAVSLCRLMCDQSNVESAAPMDVRDGCFLQGAAAALDELRYGGDE